MKKLLVLAAMLTAVVACAADELAPGAKAPAFSLVNATDGQTVSFRPGDGKLSVIIFTCNQCPYARAFEPRIIELAKEYQTKGVVFYAVNPNDDRKFPEETLDQMKGRAVAKGYPFPYLKDGDSSVARAWGARVTPHVFVVDGSGTVRYRGYVDDSAKPAERTKTGLTDALEALLSNREVAEASTRAFGCTIKWKHDTSGD
ncbi:MAG TPA: thioredoxin family protein [Thermoanaerobaculia bacterium]|nr:thioredoxin family protein [Thermoanaerobaculia bacterium]